MKRITAILLGTIAITASFAMLPGMSDRAGGIGALVSAASPGQAEAYQAGYSNARGWHLWAKISRHEVVTGVTFIVCLRYARGPLVWLRKYCTTISNIAKRIVGGRRGFWIEVWPYKYRYGTW
ncbi:MAG: hypothetical protein WD993_09755 [Thermoleophilaceae bacterium]